MATCVINLEDDNGAPFVQISSKEMRFPITVWDRRHWPDQGVSPKVMMSLSLEEAEKFGLALIQCVAGHKAYLDNYEFWHGEQAAKRAKAAMTSPTELESVVSGDTP